MVPLAASAAIPTMLITGASGTVPDIACQAIAIKSHNPKAAIAAALARAAIARVRKLARSRKRQVAKFAPSARKSSASARNATEPALKPAPVSNANIPKLIASAAQRTRRKRISVPGFIWSWQQLAPTLFPHKEAGSPVRSTDYSSYLGLGRPWQHGQNMTGAGEEMGSIPGGFCRCGAALCPGNALPQREAGAGKKERSDDRGIDQRLRGPGLHHHDEVNGRRYGRHIDPAMELLPGGGAHPFDHRGIGGDRERSKHRKREHADRDVWPLQNIPGDRARV